MFVRVIIPLVVVALALFPFGYSRAARAADNRAIARGALSAPARQHPAPAEETPAPPPAPAEETPVPTPAPIPIPKPAPPAKLPANTINVALIGIDTRPTAPFKNTDVVIIASINPDAPAVTLLAIPRDTPVYIPGYAFTKINQAYALGGFRAFTETIRYNFGIDIHHYVMVNFAAVVNVVDILGGIEVVATCPLRQVFPKDPYYFGDPYWVRRTYTDTFTGEVWKAGMRVPTMTINIPKPGIYTLNGIEALAFARARYGVPGGDFDRGRREQRVIRAIYAKVRQPAVITRLPALYSEFAKDVVTDLTIRDLSGYVGLMSRIDEAVIRSRSLDPTGSAGVILPDGSPASPAPYNYAARVEQMLTVALNQRPNEGVPVEVVNATADPAFGIVAADRLSELGLRVASITRSTERYTQTVIVDYTTSRKGSLTPMLQKLLKVQPKNVISQPRAAGPRYRIIVGDDFNPCYYQQGRSSQRVVE